MRLKRCKAPGLKERNQPNKSPCSALTRLLFFSLLFAIGASGCYDSPKSYPYELIEESVRESRATPLDIDGDGDDEYAYILKDAVAEERDAVGVNTRDHISIDQENLTGKLIHNVYPIDIDGNGADELLLPLLRNDSVFIQIAFFDRINHKSQILSTHFLFEKPASVDSALDWDIRIRPIFKGKLEPDGDERIVFDMKTGYAKKPRGILVTSFPDFNFQDSIYTGADLRPGDNAWDYNKDGKMEYVIGTFAVGNGFSASQTNDWNAYVLNVDLVDLQFNWFYKVSHKRGEVAVVKNGDFLESPGLEIALYVLRKEKEPFIRIIDPVTGEKKKEYTHSAPIRALFRINDTQHTQAALLFWDHNSRVFRASGDLTSVEQLDVEYLGPIYRIMEVENLVDGVGKWIVMASAGRSVLFDGNLKPVAMLPYQVNNESTATLRVGSTGSRLLVLNRSGETVFYSLKHNPLFIFYRYWPVFLGGVLLIAAVLPTIEARRRITNWRSRLAPLKGKVATLQKEINELNDELALQEELHHETIQQSSERSKHNEQLQRQITEFLVPQKEDPTFVLLKTALQDNALNPDFDAAAFAERMGYSSRHLIRLVRDATGLNPSDLIWHYRVAYAKMLLEKGEMTITEIAFESGFKSPAFFSTKFQQIEGRRPTELKRST